jgi:hypothetical protein
MSETTVYQVRAIDVYGNVRIVHSYETNDAAKAAIKTMKKRTGQRYVYVPVVNKPDQYWGINFPANHPSNVVSTPAIKEVVTTPAKKATPKSIKPRKTKSN